MDWVERIKTASARIEGHIRRTPILTTSVAGLNHPIEFKLEHMQHTGSFKPRGAFNSLLSGPVPQAGLVAASGGNHGVAVGYAASRLGHSAHIFVPELAGPAKIALIEQTGARLTVVAGEYANAMAMAHDYEEASGAMQVHAYDAPATVAGQGTCLAEWEGQGLVADTVLIAVGGGGLIGGAIAWLAGRRKVVAVDPETSCALSAAKTAGEPVDVGVSGVAANALGARRIGGIGYGLAKGVQSVLVSDAAITQAQHLLWRDMRQLVEPAGATALAALLSGAYRPEPDEKVAVLLCGGNIAHDPLG